jgi:hypothetical protein
VRSYGRILDQGYAVATRRTDVTDRGLTATRRTDVKRIAIKSSVLVVAQKGRGLTASRRTKSNRVDRELSAPRRTEGSVESSLLLARRT